MYAHSNAGRSDAGQGRTTDRSSAGRAGAPLRGLPALQSAAGNAAVVQRLRQEGHSWAQAEHRHGAGCGHGIVQRAPASRVVQRAPAERTVSAKAKARLGKAAAAVNYVKSEAIQNSGNQQDPLASTLYNSAMRMAVMRENAFWDLSRVPGQPSPSDLTAAKAGWAHGGNCGENAAVAFAYLRKFAPGEHLRKASTAGLDHAFVLIGSNDEQDHEWAVADPWPTKAKACLWDEHFAYTNDRSKINVEEEMDADGADTVDVLQGLIGLNAAGEKVAKWSLNDFKKQTLDSLGAVLAKAGIAMDPSLDKGQAVLKGLQQVAGSNLADVLSWSDDQLWLWCVSQVERSVLDKVLQAGEAQPEMVHDGINEARRAAGGKFWVWNHSDTTRAGAERTHVTGASGVTAAAPVTTDDDAMDIS